MSPAPACAVFLDVGTTNSRAWLIEGSQVLARATAPVGVRATARDGSNQKLCATLAELIASVRSQPNAVNPDAPAPTTLLAAGMIGSSLGLAEVPHLIAPVSLKQLAAAVQTFSFPDITALSFKLVPGVRTAPGNASYAALDLMRGEETLCLGLLSLGNVTPPATVLNLGSHWKAIQIDASSRIVSSITTLSGEMIHAIQTSTILASTVPPEKPADLDIRWITEGMAQKRAAGLPRAMFCVRLLEQTNQATPAQRMAFLTGAFIAEDLDALLRTSAITPTQPVVVVGSAPLARAWQSALTFANVTSTLVTGAQIETATIAGLNQILHAIHPTPHQ